ncbi:MAG TPA: NAD(P)(+) transhydrogenase (Re/Si-specific) subunit beta, partial [Solirubrobacteraceae bacterium]|nr:NAD(P)(+) transhydrogenase (Re/Si-specific) subunit beta [Solirubrobacteraceae bacterium]
MTLASFLQDADFITALYIVAFSLFVIGIAGLTGPRTAVRGNRIAAVGMAIAVVATLLYEQIGDWELIALGIAIGTLVGVPAARNVKMTA